MLRLNSKTGKSLIGKNALIKTLNSQIPRCASTGASLESEWKKIAQKQLKEKPVESLTFKTAEVIK